MSWSEAEQLLRKHWGYDQFRPEQEQIVRSILEGNNCLATLSTGGGKSICFQIPALLSEGVSIVVSPLIALMNDQVSQLRSRNIKAELIAGSMSTRQIETAIDNCIYGNTKLLYLSPERLKSISLQQRFDMVNISYLVVDEAHCISQWGHDFRPAYLDIGKWMTSHQEAKVIALTGTATKQVQQDIKTQLKLDDATSVFNFSVERKNIHYRVSETEDKRRALLLLLPKLGSSGIVYSRSRKKTEEISKYLQANNFDCNYYHAGLSLDDRKKVEKSWLTGECDLVVATNAFGMGIDKAKVDFVIHMELPNNLEEYLQESGRAGRNGDAAEAILLFNDEDVQYQKQLLNYRFPSLKFIQQVYSDLGNFFQFGVGGGTGKGFPFDIYKFCRRFDYEPLMVHHTIKILEGEGYLLLTEKNISSSKLQIVAEKHHLRKVIDNGGFPADVLSTLLRSYTGLFNESQRISESLIAEQLNCSDHAVKNCLQILEKRNLVHYLSPSFYPVIIYTSDRIHGKNLVLSTSTMQERQKNALRQLKATLAYVKSDRCRTAVYVHYFGERMEQECGHCDNCIKQGPAPNIESQIMDQLESPKSLLELIQILDHEQEHIIEGVRILLSEQKVKRKGRTIERA